MNNQKKVKIKCLSLYYSLIVLLIILSLFNFTMMVGINWFVTESILIIYLGGVSLINKTYIISKSLGILLIIIISMIYNRILFEETKDFDDSLEDNETVIKAYDKYKIDFLGFLPFFIDLGLSYISCFYLLKSFSNALIIIIILIGFWEIIIAATLIANKRGLGKFLEKKE